MADSTVKEWMEAQDGTQRETMAIDMAGSIDLGVMAIQNVLLELQPYLNGNATQIEAGDGMELLSVVLSRLQTDLGRADLHALVEYLCTRLENKDAIPNFQAGVKWTARSLQALAQMIARFPRGDASVVARAVFSLPSTSFKEQLPSTRLTVFELLDFLLHTYSAPITRDMGPQLFAEGLVSMAEFEKDPRCLKVLFEMYEEISRNWSLSSESFSAIWGSFHRYFPITLKTTDTSVPTREDLQQLIVQCFASNDHYASHAFPYLLSALDTTQEELTASVKNTILETFEACISHYSVSVTTEWSSKIWDALKFEVWNGTYDEFIDRTLQVIKALGKKLDSGALDWQSVDSPFAQFIVTVSTEATQRLHDSKSQHVLGSGRILRVIASSSHFGFYLVAKAVFPRLFVIWDDPTSKDKKIPLLGVFGDLLQARLDLRDALNIALQDPLRDRNAVQALQSSEDMLATMLAVFQQSIVDDVFIHAMLDDSSGEPAVNTPYKVNAIKGLVLGARIPGFLSDYSKGIVFLQFSKLAVDPSQSEDILAHLITALRQISVEDIIKFRDVTLTTFMGELPSCISSESDSEEQINNIVMLLDALTQISCSATCKNEMAAPLRPNSNFKFRIFEEFQYSLLKKFHAVLQFPGQLPFANAILAAMYRGLQLLDEVLAQEEASGDLQPLSSSDVSPYYWIVWELYGSLLQQREHHGGKLNNLHYIGFQINLDQDPKINDMFVLLLGNIATLSLRSTQTTTLSNFLFHEDTMTELSQIWYLFCKEPPTPSICISQQNLESGPVEKCLTNVLSMSMVAGIRRNDKNNVRFDIGNAAISMIKNAISTQNNECSHYARVSMLHFLQLLINKFGATKEKIENEDRNLVQVMIDLVTSCDAKNDELKVLRIYQTLAYFTAACLAAGDRSDKDLIAQMITGISDARVGRKVAQSFRILLAPSPVMNEDNFCVIRRLRKQRLYQLTVDHLIEMWRMSRNKDEKDNCLIALAGIFANMEPKILEENAATFFPLVLEGTNVQNDDHTMYTYIVLIHALVTVKPDIVSRHIDSIINRMTDRTHNTYDSPSDASVKCRTAALEVLSLVVSHLERRLLLRRKAKIIVELDVALDDCSRTVRSAAERTKMRWFNLVEADT